MQHSANFEKREKKKEAQPTTHLAQIIVHTEYNSDYIPRHKNRGHTRMHMSHSNCPYVTHTHTCTNVHTPGGNRVGPTRGLSMDSAKRTPAKSGTVFKVEKVTMVPTGQ